MAAMDLGYEVHVVAIDDGVAEKLKNTGVIFHVRSMQNNTSPVIASVLGLLQLLIISTKVRPSILHFIGLKSSPVGLVSALFFGVAGSSFPSMDWGICFQIQNWVFFTGCSGN